jgi:hypothetical protein
LRSEAIQAERGRLNLAEVATAVTITAFERKSKVGA